MTGQQADKGADLKKQLAIAFVLGILVGIWLWPSGDDPEPTSSKAPPVKTSPPDPGVTRPAPRPTSPATPYPPAPWGQSGGQYAPYPPGSNPWETNLGYPFNPAWQPGMGAPPGSGGQGPGHGGGATWPGGGASPALGGYPDVGYPSSGGSGYPAPGYGGPGYGYGGANPAPGWSPGYRFRPTESQTGAPETRRATPPGAPSYPWEPWQDPYSGPPTRATPP